MRYRRHGFGVFLKLLGLFLSPLVGELTSRTSPMRACWNYRLQQRFKSTFNLMARRFYAMLMMTWLHLRKHPSLFNENAG